MHSGTVKWFDSCKGYGFIADDNGQDVFAHQSNILMNGFRELATGQRVKFHVEAAEKGNVAVNVIIVE